jgi:hypothetical protein
MKKYEIAYQLKAGNSGIQKTVVTASDSTTAKKLWEQQNPGCKFSSVNQLPIK